MNLRLSPSVLALAALLTPLPCLAITCDELKSEVEAKIRGTGVSRFSISVVEAGAPSSGKVVGTCDRGARKLVYMQAVAASSASQSPSRPTKAAAPIITECKDGSVSRSGECPK